MLSSQAVIQELLYLVSIILRQYDNPSSEVGALPPAPCWLQPCPPSPRMPKCLCSHTPGCRQQQLLPAEVASCLPKWHPRSTGQTHVALVLGERAHKAPARGRDTSTSLFFFSLVLLSVGRSPQWALLRCHQGQSRESDGLFWFILQTTLGLLVHTCCGGQLCEDPTVSHILSPDGNSAGLPTPAPKCSSLLPRLWVSAMGNHQLTLKSYWCHLLRAGLGGEWQTQVAVANVKSKTFLLSKDREAHTKST